ncbi:hypothetical protein MMC30_006837 [Trapelia coarctata]|nr:hypothetical protein [Trapelia coarctata]
MVSTSGTHPDDLRVESLTLTDSTPPQSSTGAQEFPPSDNRAKDERSLSSWVNGTWIPDISLFLTCAHTREYLAFNHAARHEFLARNAKDWLDLAKEQFFVQADECQVSCEEFLGNDGEEEEEEEVEDVIRYGRYDHEVQIVSGGEYNEGEDVIICDASEGEDSGEIDDDEDVVMSVEHNDNGCNADVAPRFTEREEEEKRDEEHGWAEVENEIDAFFKGCSQYVPQSNNHFTRVTTSPTAHQTDSIIAEMASYLQGPRTPVVFVLGDDSETNSDEDLNSDSETNTSILFENMDDSPPLRRTPSLPDLNSLPHPLDWAYEGRRTHMNAPTLRMLLFGGSEYNAFRDRFFAAWGKYNGNPWALTSGQFHGDTQPTRQLARAFLGRRMSEGGGEHVRESWQQFVEEDLINIQFRHLAGLQPIATNSWDGAWNDDLDSGIDARFRQSPDAPFLTRERLAWSNRSGSVSRRSASVAGHQEEDDDEWVWCDTIPETSEDSEWNEEGAPPEEDERVEEESLPTLARTLFAQAFRRLAADLAR